MKNIIRLVAPAVFLIVGSVFVLSTPSLALPYGAGLYDSCTYGTCGITLTSNGTVSLDLLPSGSTTCSTAKDDIVVSTGASTGYTLQLEMSGSSNSLAGATSSSTVSAGTGTIASPNSLTANSWGYRVDGQGGFGAGPTSTQSNATSLARIYAAVPLITPDTIKQTAVAADDDPTAVWYGMCADNSLNPDTYTGTVTYTAITNP